MVRIVSVDTLGLEYGSYHSLEGIDFSHLLEDNPNDDLILKSVKLRCKRRVGRKQKRLPTYSVPVVRPTEIVRVGVKINS
jgi:hypothetical protein